MSVPKAQFRNTFLPSNCTGKSFNVLVVKSSSVAFFFTLSINMWHAATCLYHIYIIHVCSEMPNSSSPPPHLDVLNHLFSIFKSTFLSLHWVFNRVGCLIRISCVKLFSDTLVSENVEFAVVII